MNYFLGISIPQVITGVDRAQYNRLKLFKMNNHPAKIVTIQYNHLASLWARQHGIEHDVLNMYDYFQQATYYEANNSFNWIQYWKDQNYEVTVLRNKLDIRIMQAGKMIMYARFLDTNLRQPLFINYFNNNNQFVKHEEYDVRGFLSSASHYANGKDTVYQEFFTPNGEKVIEKYYTSKENDANANVIYLKNKYGIFDRFSSEQELVTHFFDTIANTNDLFIIDRPLEIVPSFLNMKHKINALVVIHMTHLSEINPDNERLKWPYDLLFKNLYAFKGLITSTKAQKDDITKYIERHDNMKNIPIYHIPVGFVENKLTPLNISKKQPFKIISIARYVEGKQLEDQINIIHQLKNEFPEITLDLYGFGSQQNKLQNLINTLDANDYICLKGYAQNLSDIYSSATLSLLTSKSEGFSLAILESLSHHTPVVSYDVEYGPNEMIMDGVNGNLIPYNNLNQLYEILKHLLSNPQHLKSYYENCENSLSPYTRNEVYKKWNNLIQVFNMEGEDNDNKD